MLGLLLLVCAASAMEFVEIEVLPMRMARASDDDAMSRIVHNGNFRRMLVQAMERMEAQMEHDLERMQDEVEEAQPARRSRRAVHPHPISPLKQVAVGGAAKLVASAPGRFVYDVCFRPLELPVVSAGRAVYLLELSTTQPTRSMALQNPASNMAPLSIPISGSSATIRLAPVEGSFVLRVFSGTPLQGARLLLGGVSFAAVSSPATCRVFAAPLLGSIPLISTTTTMPRGALPPFTTTMPHGVMPPHPPTTSVPENHGPHGFVARLMFAPPLLLASAALLLLLLVLRCCCRPRRCNNANNAVSANGSTPVAAQQVFAHPPPPPALALYSAPPVGYAPVAQGPHHLAVYPRY